MSEKAAHLRVLSVLSCQTAMNQQGKQKLRGLRFYGQCFVEFIEAEA